MRIATQYIVSLNFITDYEILIFEFNLSKTTIPTNDMVA